MLVAAVLSGCQTQGTPTAVEQPYVEERNITFATADGVELQLDLVTPTEGEGPFPALVFIFNLGWMTGGRVSFSRQAQWAAQRGYVAATVDQRKNLEGAEPKYRFPAPVHDVKCAVRWLRSHAGEYAIDPDRIGAVGWFSGGHLALMLALTDPSDGLEGDCGDMDIPSHVHVAANLNGPTDLCLFYEASGTYGKGAVSRLLGSAPEESIEACTMASPVHYVSPADPPVLTLLNEAEDLVPASQGQLLDDRMKEAGASHVLHIVEGGDFFDDREAYEIVFEFLDEHLK
jgi:acetyl esterase/lipase